MDITAVPQGLKEKPPTPLETAKREYNLAMIAMAELDTRVIDTAATLEELKEAYGEAVARVNRARDAMIEARTPTQAADVGEGLRAIECGQPKPGANGFAEGDNPPPAAA